MTKVAIKGTFHLASGARLIERGRQGTLLMERPLRGFRVNAAALQVLEQCREGLRFDREVGPGSDKGLLPALPLLDRLRDVGLVEWRPSDELFEPFVSIVVAVYNRARDVGECLTSLCSLDYPGSLKEIIVVDDGSRDDTVSVVQQFDVRLIPLGSNRGQSAARNVGVQAANGEIIAFVDSDCMVDQHWLRELVPFFQDSRTVLVGGYVASYYTRTWLDRYEESQSALNMGEREVIGSGSDCDFYVPTCNMLVRKEAYLAAGGLDETMRVGEDVDLCWRLKERGFRLVYSPKGRVLHKHRSSFVETFTRRYEYGTSEPLLYVKHPQVRKRYPWQPWSMAVLLSGILGVALLRVEPFVVAGLTMLLDASIKRRQYQRQLAVPLDFQTVFRATAEKHFQLAYHFLHHVIRYYLLLIIALACFFTDLVPAALGLILFPSISEFCKRPRRLSFPVFLFYFLVEQASYQIGVLWGSIRHRTWQPYRLVFSGTVPRKTRAAKADADA